VERDGGAAQHGRDALAVRIDEPARLGDHRRMSTESPRITLRRRGDPAVTKAIIKGLKRYNAKQTGVRDFVPLQVAARTRAGRIIGGLEGIIGYRWLFIRWLWIDDKHRRGGVGRSLIARAEVLARKHGAIGAWVDTFSFQARPFYEKLGFRLFGTINEYPPGHKRFFLKKRFRRSG
jgi:GNAT superfamily N-acetyltransferase